MPNASTVRLPRPRRVATGALLLASLVLVACEKTVVREVPTASGPATPGPFSDPLDAPSGGGAGADAGSDPGETLGQDGLPEVERTAGAIAPDTVSGEPGAAVDCALALPCRWTSEDEGFALTLTSGDDTAARDGLALSFRVDTLHDTELLFGGVSEATDTNGVQYTPVARALGSGNGTAPQGVLAGAGVDGRIEHATGAGRNTLARVRIALLDNGLVREAAFTNVPLGPRESAVAECAMTLPCTWTSADGGTTVELISAGGLTELRRLTAGFLVTTSDGSAVALAGGEALGDDGTEFASRNHSLGTESGYEPVSSGTTAGIPRAGTVDFRRTATTPASLRVLTLDLYPDAPVPRWSVVFSEVPLL